MNKSFFVKAAGTGACYCGRCGKRQLADRYNMQKHEQICNPQYKDGDEVYVVEEGSSWGYCLESTEKEAPVSGRPASGTPAPATNAPGTPTPSALTLFICVPVLIRSRGFKDRFSGMECGSRSLPLSLRRAPRIHRFCAMRPAMRWTYCCR